MLNCFQLALDFIHLRRPLLSTPAPLAIANLGKVAVAIRTAPRTLATRASRRVPASTCAASGSASTGLSFRAVRYVRSRLILRALADFAHGASLDRLDVNVGAHCA